MEVFFQSGMYFEKKLCTYSAFFLSESTAMLSKCRYSFANTKRSNVCLIIFGYSTGRFMHQFFCYSVKDRFCKRSHYISIKFPLHKQSENS